jgi:putative hydrolase of the HAD superfamily
VIRGIFFDAGDVLYTRKATSHDHVRSLLSERGYRADALDEHEPGLARSRREASTGRITPREYWSRALECCAVAARDLSDLLDEIDVFADRVEGAPGARDMVTELRRRGMAIGIVTDTMYPLERKMRWLADAGVADLVDVVACSTVLGVKKPDPAIYLYALDRTGVAAGEAAFVGHSAAELEGARALGMTTVAIHPEPTATADRTVATLSDLVDLDVLTP